MKNSIHSFLVGACMLLPSAGMVLAANPHTFTMTKGQPGTTNGITCSQTVGPGPGGSANGIASPFNPTATPPYAGNPGNPTGPGGAVTTANPAAVSQYDVACFQAP